MQAMGLGSSPQEPDGSDMVEAILKWESNSNGVLICYCFRRKSDEILKSRAKVGIQAKYWTVASKSVTNRQKEGQQ